MASTFTLKSNSYQGRYMQLTCTQAKDIATNSSVIDWTLSSIGGSSTYYSTGATTVTIDGTDVYYLERKNWDTKVFPAAKGSVSGSFRVYHNNEGKKSISVSVTTAIYVGQTTKYTDTWHLDDLPRQATLNSAPNFTDLDNPTITYSNPAGNAVDSLMACISFTGNADNIAYRDISKAGTSYTFNFTDAERDWLRENTTTGKRNVMFFVRTIIGGNTFFSIITKELTIVETNNTKPSVTMTATLNNDSLPSAFRDTYVQGKSRLNLTLSAQGKYGASISFLNAIVGNQGYSTMIGGTSTAYTGTLLTDAITQSGNVSIETSVTDSRGFKGVTTQQINILPYSKPLVIPIGNENAILCYRSDGNGKKVGGSSSVWIKAKRLYYNLSGKNTCALQWRRRLITSDAWEDWKDLIPKSNTSTNEYNALIQGVTFELNKSYAVQIRAMDDIGEYDIKDFEIPTQDVAFHLGKGGKNVTIGGYCDYSEDYTFRSMWKAIFDKGIVDKTDTGWKAINGVIQYRYTCGYVTVSAVSRGEITLINGDYLTVGTIPEEYRPKTTIPFVFNTMGGSAIGQSAFIETDGQIRMYSNVGGASYWAFTITYPL